MDNIGLRIAIQGEVGSFSEEAAFKLLGTTSEIKCCRSFEEVFKCADLEEVDSCLIPLENSLTGSIHRNYDLLLKSQLKINREVYLRIEHNLIVIPGVEFGELTAVFSHPVALGQCEKFFQENPDLEVHAAHDTSGSVREMMERGDRWAAAVAGRRAAEIFRAEVLRASIQDNDENFTRFVLLSKRAEEPVVADKTSIVFSFRNSPGALFKSLGVFALREIDLTKIESRPIPGRPWEYLFYLDFLGSTADRKVQNALEHLKEIADHVDILGSYPRDLTASKSAM